LRAVSQSKKYNAEMTKRSAMLTLAAIALDPSSRAPLHRQLYEILRKAILERKLRAGARLPSTRSLAKELTVSRTTVINAFDQLLAEGYIEGKAGSGTFVTVSLPDDLLRVRSRAANSVRSPAKRRAVSQRGRLFAATAASFVKDEGKARAFQPGLPSIDDFPFDIWARMISKRWRQCSSELAGYGHAAGYRPLREAIANYAQLARGVRCEPEQIIIVAGSQQGLDLAARALLDPGDTAWIEDPAYRGACGALLGAGAKLAPIPVDEQGLDVAAGESICREARVAYVTPSHQYPLGITMSLARRLALLDWATRSDAWIIEDDYDSEYRYTGRPLAALQGLDKEDRVIYIGTFSKVLFPSLRLGYLVVPTDLVDIFSAAHAHTACYSPLINQAVLADFITEGHFARHIRRMRGLYEQRQSLLVQCAERELGRLLEVRPAGAGMHLIGWLPGDANDQVVSRHAAKAGIDVRPLSFYCIEARHRGGLLLGYTGIPEAEIKLGAQKLATVLRSALSG
jgi:GntR family transcriptional regulator / MocR family aminotransferase